MHIPSYTNNTGYHPNSLFAWGLLNQKNEQGEKKLTERQREVYDAAVMMKRRFTATELADYMGWPINRVSGRVGELDDKKMIINVGEKYVGRYRHDVWEVGKIIN